MVKEWRTLAGAGKARAVFDVFAASALRATLAGGPSSRLTHGLALIFLVHAELLFAQPAPLEGAELHEYKRVGETSLHLHVFAPEGHRASDQRPAILFFSGGAWVAQSTGYFHRQCRDLAARGMVTVAVEYRVQRSHGTTPFENVEDAKSAIRWVRSNAARLGVAKSRIAAAGDSAGGHLAVAAALVEGFEGDGEALMVRSTPDALVLFAPILDTGPDGFGHERVKPRWREVSPIHNIAGPTPPMVIFLGAEDRVVPINGVREFKRLIEDAGGRADLQIYAGQGHGFVLSSHEHYQQTTLETVRFLTSLGWLDETAVH